MARVAEPLAFQGRRRGRRRRRGPWQRRRYGRRGGQGENELVMLRKIFGQLADLAGGQLTELTHMFNVFNVNLVADGEARPIRWPTQGFGGRRLRRVLSRARLDRCLDRRI